MSNYFALGFRYGSPNYAHIATDATLDVVFFTGQSLAARFPSTEVALEPQPPPPDFIAAGSLDIVSLRLRSFLEEQSVRAEFIEIRLTQSGEPVAAPYFFMNPLEVRACLDRKRSRFDEFPAAAGGGILSIHHLVLDETCVAGSPLFVLEDKIMVLVREDLVSALQARKFTGLTFRPLPTGPF